MKWYGSLDNRIEENKMYCEEIKVGTGVTEYLWSDRNAYEVIKVENQKHIWIRRYDVKCVGGDYSNEWKLISNPENKPIELVYRYNTWKVVNRFNLEWYNNLGKFKNYFICMPDLTDKEIEKILEGKEVVKYSNMTGKLSFGVADYYYDYEF